MDTPYYREIVRNLILEYGSHKPSQGEITAEVVIDDEKGHYEVLNHGWQGQRRVHGAVIHIDVIDDKVWIQYDGTSPGVALELESAGIPREKIVLGFQPARVRPLTGYGVG